MAVSYIIDERDLYIARGLAMEVLDLDLRWKHDLEVGSEIDDYNYFECRFDAGSPSRIANVTLVGENSPPLGWAVQGRPFRLKVIFGDPDLLEVGRLATHLEQVPQIHLFECSISLESFDPSGGFWRYHYRRFGPRAKPTTRNLQTICEPRAHWKGSPELRCQLVIGFSNRKFDEVRELTSRVLDLTWIPHQVDNLPGPFLCALPRAEDSDGITLLLRGNRTHRGKLYESHDEKMPLLDIDLVTGNLLDLGRIAGFIEEATSGAAHVVAYSAHGDLIKDGIRRSVMRRFSSEAEARSTWREGHSRPQEDDDSEDDSLEG
jgi:hypothetical protein